MTGAAGLGALTLLHVRDPHVEGSYGFCPFSALTGILCPGCGGLRATHDLTHGDLGSALSSNAFAVLLVLGTIGLWIVWTVRRARGEPASLITIPTWAVVPGVVLICVFWIVRLTPAGAGLAP